MSAFDQLTSETTSVPASNESWTSKVVREATAIGGGAALGGISNGLSDAAAHPFESAANLATSAALMLAARGPIWLKAPAAVVGVLGTVDFGIHAEEKIANALPAIQDLWASDKNAESNQKTINSNLGPLAFNAAAMGIAGLGAGYFGGKAAATELQYRSKEVAQFSPDTSVVTLGRDNLTAATVAVKAGFNYAGDVLHPETDFRASLYPRFYNKIYGNDPHAPIDAKYLLAVGRNKNDVLGTTGLYRDPADKNEATWLGWFSVTPDNRGQGLGKKLLDFSIDQAKANDSRYLRLYTSDHPGEAVAQHLYDQAGFKTTNIDPPNEHGVRIIYKELDLKPEAHTAEKVEAPQFKSAPVTDDSWHHIYETQFPAEEQQEYTFFQGLAAEGATPQVKLQLSKNGEQTVAFSMTSDYGDLGADQGRGLLLPYIAVEENLQGQGIGGAHLEQMFEEAKNTYPTAKGMVVEVEDPQAPGISSEDAMKRQQRIDWYARHDSHVLDKPYLIPSAEEGADPLPGRLIWRDFGRGGLTDNGLNTLIAKIYEHGYGLTPDNPIVQRVLGS